MSTAFAIGLGACSAEPPQPPSAPVAARGVFTSAADCAALGKLSLEKCARAIEQAVADHEANAPVYSSLKACEKAEGPDKCERTDAKTYRPRLMAFLVELTDRPYGAPLYPTARGETGFRTAGNSLLLSDDETLTFSRPALGAAELMAGKSNGGGGLF
jgi:hypothetical protein